MGDSDHRETKAILKIWFIYIPLALGELIFSNIIGYFKKIKIKILHWKNN
uniref:Uncharacterized protein n=1 Tax=Bacillus cereus HuA4-10 TaxID=1053206 RepID=J8DVJ1_BACCE|nr:hypothetical protein IGC_02336 [Bacillus cereus HuA4-10]